MHTDTNLKVAYFRHLIHEMDDHDTDPGKRLPPPVLEEAFEDDREVSPPRPAKRKWEIIR